MLVIYDTTVQMVVSSLRTPVTASCVTVNGLTITATVDNIMTIYNEGVIVLSNDEWEESTVVTIDDPCVLAIEGERHTLARACSTCNPMSCTQSWAPARFSGRVGGVENHSCSGVHKHYLLISAHAISSCMRVSVLRQILHVLCAKSKNFRGLTWLNCLICDVSLSRYRHWSR